MLIMPVKKRREIKDPPQGFEKCCFGLDLLLCLWVCFTFIQKASKLLETGMLSLSCIKLQEGTQREDDLVALIEFPLYYLVYIVLNVRHGKHLPSIQTI